ncbi:MAG TPA: Maf family protein [Blastocatellia bacterium]|nr:Maf family protein [Blastocatellia bacterium]
MARIILASGSPRRRELLAGLGINFEVKPSSVPEQIGDDESPAAYVERLAREKAVAVANNLNDAIVIGADTTVVIDNQVLEKPVDRDDARRMLSALSGRWHTVLTGVCLIDCQTAKVVSGVESTDVLFQNLNDDDLEWYLNTNEPYDKAGAYAIQGYGSLIVDKVKGNYFNVVGLPINLLKRLSIELGCDIKNWQRLSLPAVHNLL